MLGPCDDPPLPGLVYSLINIVPKPGTKKYHLVHDLLHPRNSDESVNSCIPEENSSVKYKYIEDVTDMGPASGARDMIGAHRYFTCF